jgi:AraC-like DNA-binding protein
MAAERAFYRYDRELGVELIRATYRDHRFPPHVHDGYLLGRTIAGVEAFTQGGRRYRSTAGKVRTINPGTVHDGGSGGDEPWTYQALYVPTASFAALCGADGAAPRLRDPVIDDTVLAAALDALFATMIEEPEASAREDALARFVALLGARAQLELAPPGPDHEHRAVCRARKYLRAHALGPVPLGTLADVAGLSKFHLLRLFKAETGLTPWQYQTQLRIDAARAMLARGEPPSQVAAACGFVDQSHMTRRFRSVVGITPAAYASYHRPTLVAADGCKRSART